MKRLIVFILTLSLTSCSYIGATEDILVSSPPTQASSTLPSDAVISTDGTSGSNLTDSSVTPSLTSGVDHEATSLILNTSSKKIHYFETCSYAARMKEENKSVVPYEQYTSLLSSGYTVCSWCEKQIEKN